MPFAFQVKMQAFIIACLPFLAIGVQVHDSMHAECSELSTSCLSAVLPEIRAKFTEMCATTVGTQCIARNQMMDRLSALIMTGEPQAAKLMQKSYTVLKNMQDDGE